MVLLRIQDGGPGPEEFLFVGQASHLRCECVISNNCRQDVRPKVVEGRKHLREAPAKDIHSRGEHRRVVPRAFESVQCLIQSTRTIARVHGSEHVESFSTSGGSKTLRVVNHCTCQRTKREASGHYVPKRSTKLGVVVFDLVHNGRSTGPAEPKARALA